MKKAKPKVLSAVDKLKFLLLPLEPFEFPSAIPRNPQRPCSHDKLLLSVQRFLHRIENPVYAVTVSTTGPLSNERVMWAKLAMMELWNWIALHSANGNREAQRAVFDSALCIVQSFLTAAEAKLPGIVNRAKTSHAIPGLISCDPVIQESMVRVCADVKQGKQYPFPSEPSGRKSVKQKAKLSTAQHDLVERLWTYAEDHRRRTAHAAYFAQEAIDRGLTRKVVNPLLLAMLDLPPLSCSTWKQWRDVGTRVIKERTNGNPAQHPAFQRGGRYAGLGMQSTRAKRKEFKLWTRLAEAWKLRAKYMSALPADSVHRKAYSRQ